PRREPLARPPECGLRVQRQERKRKIRARRRVEVARTAARAWPAAIGQLPVEQCSYEPRLARIVTAQEGEQRQDIGDRCRVAGWALAPRAVAALPREQPAAEPRDCRADLRERRRDGGVRRGRELPAECDGSGAQVGIPSERDMDPWQVAIIYRGAASRGKGACPHAIVYAGSTSCRTSRAQALPLRTAPSWLPKKSCCVQSPARNRFGTGVRWAGRRDKAPGSGRIRC